MRRLVLGLLFVCAALHPAAAAAGLAGDGAQQFGGAGSFFNGAMGVKKGRNQAEMGMGQN